MRILVVDDASLGRVIVRMILEKLGHEVLEATSIKSAIVAFHKEHPDFVFTDLNLAGESGLQIFAEVGAAFPEVPFVLMTASQNDADYQTALADGIREVIHKPISMEQITKLLDKHKPTDANKRLFKVSLSLESRFMERARILAREKNCTPELILQELLQKHLEPEVAGPAPAPAMAATTT